MSKRYYNGQGDRHSAPLILPTIDHAVQTSPSGYLASPDLAAAVDTALTLGMPLLLTGEPGSGKSALAKSIAWEVLGDDEKPLEFIVKSDTRAIDLFYRFDSIGRFHAANTTDGLVAAEHFLHFNAVGQAILQAKPFQYVSELLKNELRAKLIHSGEQKRSVVLIDEIDKAPRDVPNDMLVELEQLCFDIQELQTRVDLQGDESHYQPIIIITSNSEKALPEAFLRRCVYHHLQFPAFEKEAGETAVTVRDIVDRRLGCRFTWEEGLLQDTISWFKYLRKQASGIEKKPSMAEFLNWLEYLQATNPHATTLNPESVQLQQSISNVLLKKSQDQAQCQQWLSQWKAER